MYRLCLALAALSGCAIGQQELAVTESRQSWLQRQTTALDVGQNIWDVAKKFGPPDSQQAELCGPQGQQWKCMAWLYYGNGRDRLLMLFERRNPEQEIWTLNTWRWLY
jgi:hypothetical protein